MNGKHRWIGLLTPLFVLTLLTSCSQKSTPTPTPAATPIPAIPLNANGGTAKASGKVVPALKADLGFSATGRVKSVAVDVNAPVNEGDLLAVLHSAAAEAAVAQAQATLEAAQAHLRELQAGARPQEIAAARARVEVAEAQRAQLSEAGRASAIKAAQVEVEAAQAALDQLSKGPREEERIAAEADLANASAALKQARAAYDPLASRSDVGMLPESLALEQATNNYNAAQARYDALFARPTANVAATAKARLQQAEAVLDRLEHPGTAAQVAAAEAQVHNARAQLDMLTAGTRPEAIAAAEAAVAQAQAALQRAQADLTGTELRAPFAGTIAARHANPGEMVQAGQTVLTLADLSGLRVETTDLSERDVAHVAAGQSATVFVEALGKAIAGRVVRVSPQANVVGGDVVYTVVIELDEQPAGLRWGMSADVEIGLGGQG